MSYLDAIRNMGASVRLSKAGKLKLSGTGDHDSVIAYVREHKVDIVHEIESSDLPNPDLPPTCPLNTGGYAPDGCRFATKMIVRLIHSGVLPDAAQGCPMRSACGLFCEWSIKPRQHQGHKCMGVSCESGSFNEVDNITYLWCGEAQAPVIDLPVCPQAHWHRDERGQPFHGPGTTTSAEAHQEEPTPRQIGPPGDCENCPAYDLSLDRCYGIAFFQHKAGPWYNGQEALGRCPRKEKQP